MRNIVLLFIFFSASIISFGQFNLLKDINQTEAGSNPQNFVEANGFVFFTVQTNDGYELWQSDGTEEGTKRATELLLYGVRNTSDKRLYVFENELYFVAVIAQGQSYTLMKTNGVSVETVLPNVSPDARFYFFNGKPHYIIGATLYAVDNQIPVLIATFSAAYNGDKQVPQVLNDKLVFFGKKRDLSSSSGYSLDIWVSDGSNQDTERIKTIENMPSGRTSGYPTIDQASVVANGKCFFVLELEGGQIELWETDGSSTGTSRIKVINGPRASIFGEPITEYLHQYKNGIAFISKRRELWFSNGTEAGTSNLLTSVFPSSFDYYQNFWGELNNELFFPVLGSSNKELWKTDGTNSGTVLVSNVFGADFNVEPNQFTQLNNNLYFVALRNQIWKTDGTTSGTVYLADIPRPSGTSDDTKISTSRFISNSNLLYFSNYQPQTGYELWVSDGTTTGTKLLKNITTGTSNSIGSLHKKVGNSVYFYATDATHGYELWRTDGTENGTQLVVDLSPGPSNTRIVSMNSIDEVLFFSAYTSDAPTSLKLFRSDGTASGTVELSMDDGTNTFFEPNALIPVDNKLYIRGKLQNINSYSLWVLDDYNIGSPVRITPTTGSISAVSEYAVVGKKLYFSNSRLWVSEGTNETTKQVFSGTSTYANHTPRNLTSFKGKVYYRTTYLQNSSFITGIIESDGTETGTQVFHQFDNSTQSFNEIFGITKTDNYLYFSANVVRDSTDIWVSDGSLSNAEFLKRVPEKIFNYTFKNLGDTLFIINRAAGIRGHFQIVVTDGTSSGTRQLINLTDGSSPSPEVIFNDKIYFSVFTPTSGYELWRSDGSVTGTFLIKDLREGDKNSAFSDITAVNDKLLAWIYDERYGIEPWTYTPEICEGGRNHTVKSGTWNDVSVWSCGSIPTSSDYVIIKNGHSVSIPTEYRAYSKFISTEAGAVLDIERGAVFKTDN